MMVKEKVRRRLDRKGKGKEREEEGREMLEERKQKGRGKEGGRKLYGEERG